MDNYMQISYYYFHNDSVRDNNNSSIIINTQERSTYKIKEKQIAFKREFFYALYEFKSTFGDTLHLRKFY